MMFTPSETSRASVLHHYVRDQLLDAGDELTYATAIDLLGVELGPHERPSDVLSHVVNTVNRRLHREGDWRHLVNVVGVGYKVGTPNDVRGEALARLAHSTRQQVSSLRATEKIVRHPDATPGERKRAADAAASQAALLQMNRKEQRRIRSEWPAEEQSPVMAQ